MRVPALTRQRHRVRFKALRFAHGYLDRSEEPPLIEIGLLGRTQPARTYLHELLHLRHPEWTESRVLREESRAWKSLTVPQRAALYRSMMRRAA